MCSSHQNLHCSPSQPNPTRPPSVLNPLKGPLRFAAPNLYPLAQTPLHCCNCNILMLCCHGLPRRVSRLLIHYCTTRQTRERSCDAQNNAAADILIGEKQLPWVSLRTGTGRALQEGPEAFAKRAFPLLLYFLQRGRSAALCWSCGLILARLQCSSCQKLAVWTSIVCCIIRAAVSALSSPKYYGLAQYEAFRVSVYTM